jgi:hypothetical protein
LRAGQDFDCTRHCIFLLPKWFVAMIPIVFSDEFPQVGLQLLQSRCKGGAQPQFVFWVPPDVKCEQRMMHA